MPVGLSSVPELCSNYTTLEKFTTFEFYSGAVSASMGRV